MSDDLFEFLAGQGTGRAAEVARRVTKSSQAETSFDAG
jgi:hypothetical protein